MIRLPILLWILVASIQSVPLGRSDDGVITTFPTAECSVAKVGSAFQVSPGEQIEGIDGTVAVSFQNKTGSVWKDIVGKSSCGCLASKSIDGKTVEPDGDLTVQLTITPSTRAEFQQNFELHGRVGESEKRELIGVVAIKAAVKRPVKIHPTGFSLEDFKNEKIRLQSMVLSGADGRTEIVWDQISIQSEDLEMQFDHRDSVTYGEAKYSIKAGIPDQKDRDLLATLLVPFRVKGKEGVFISQTPIRVFVTKALKVAPAAVNLRKKEGADNFEISLVVTDRRGDSGSLDLVYQLVRKKVDGEFIVIVPKIEDVRTSRKGNVAEVAPMVVKVVLPSRLLEGNAEGGSFLLRVIDAETLSGKNRHQFVCAEVQLILEAGR